MPKVYKIINTAPRANNNNNENNIAKATNNNMKTNLLKSLFISLILVMGVNNVWALDASNAIVYYDNTASNWSDVQILIGHSTWSSVYTLSKISGTNNLYCKTSLSWGNYTEFYFVTGASSWGDEGNSPTHRKGYVTNYSAKKTTGLSSNKYLYVSSGTSKGASLTETKLNNGYSDLNYTQTVQQHLSTDGGTNYSASTAALATVKVSSNKLNGNSSTTSSSGTIASGNSSTTCSAARTATVTYTVSDVKAGYTFVGWYDGTTQKSTNTTYSYNATEAKTITARFKQETTYTVTINAEANGSVSPSGDQQIGASETSITATPDAGYRFVNWTVTGGATVANATNATTTVTATTNGTVTAHFEEIPPKTIYLKPNNRWKTDKARFVAYVWNAEGDFWFDMVDEDESGYYTCTIPSKYTNLIFVRMDPSKPDNNWDNDWNQTGNLTIPLDDNNCFTLAEDEQWNGATITWSKYTPSAPYNVNDYRLVYIESEVLGETPYTKFHPAHAITKQATGTKLDTVSFYINKTSGQNPAILLQRCSNIEGATITWEDITIQSINGNNGANPAAALAPAKKSAELYIGKGCPAVTENAVYNFILRQDNGTATILGEYTHPYVGNYYIRTNCADGGWSNYTTNDNLMTNSETALKHGGYDYYFCKWVANAGYNVRYTVANDYSHCVSDTLIGDTIASDGNLPAQANVRFTWNSNTNHLERAYISGSTNVSDRFLVLEGNANLKDANGNSLNVSGLGAANQAIFKDMTDWRYQVDVKVNDNTKIKLTAKYNNQIQYFKGSKDETIGIITGAKNRLYKIRLIYDFKTNYLLSALIDSDPIEEDIEVDEVMIIREHQELAQSLNVTTGSISKIQNIYGVMTFHKATLNNTEIPMMERALYWVSFPFDVHLEDAFGFGNYGEHWIMEYYDGKERAEKGGWIDATYWKYIENPSGVKLTKGVGYVLCLDLDKLKADSPIWGKATELSLYFPSLADNSTISKEAIDDVVVPAHECTINRPTPDGNRRIKDSNWNIIGVPSFANATGFDSKDVEFYYHWDAESDAYDAQIATEFNTMHAYMTQFAGTIKWTDKTIAPAAIAARKQSSGKDQYTLRLALQQEDTQCDHTFIRLQEDNATAEFDMNYDLCKIINSGANIYSMIGNVEVAANVLPVEERIIPLGLDIEEDGNYTFAMPDGTDGITAILIDYETGKETNLLLADYTVELNAGIDNERFALRVRPNHVATEVENTILTDGNDNAKKYIIDGALYLLRNGKLYDAQGRMIQQ